MSLEIITTVAIKLKLIYSPRYYLEYRLPHLTFLHCASGADSHIWPGYAASDGVKYLQTDDQTVP